MERRDKGVSRQNPMKYKAVIFDLFGTLVDNHPWDDSLNNLRQMASALSAPDDEFVGLLNYAQ